jgi:DNA-binding CsgD family transcriptional regulator
MLACAMTANGGAVLDFAFEVGAAADLGEFRTIVTAGIGQVVGCDLASYTEVDLDRRSAIALLDHTVPGAEDVVEAFGRVAHQHPLVNRRVADAQTISDYLSRRQFAALELYSDVYRRLGAGDQIAINLTTGSRRVVGIALNRPRASFDARDRAALDQLRPVLTRGYTEALARERARALVDHLEAGTDDDHVAVVACRGDGRLVYASDRALGLLRTYLGGSRLANRLSPYGMTLRGETGVLEVVPARDGSRETVLLELRERPVRSPAAALTARERQVIGRVAAGDSNQQIADGLGLSRHTVQNHLQSIYRKLDVPSRTAAVAALGALGSDSAPR